MHIFSYNFHVILYQIQTPHNTPVQDNLKKSEYDLSIMLLNYKMTKVVSYTF